MRDVEPSSASPHRDGRPDPPAPAGHQWPPAFDSDIFDPPFCVVRYIIIRSALHLSMRFIVVRYRKGGAGWPTTWQTTRLRPRRRPATGHGCVLGTRLREHVDQRPDCGDGYQLTKLVCGVRMQGGVVPRSGGALQRHIGCTAAAELRERPTAREAIAAVLRHHAVVFCGPDSPRGCMIVLAATTCSDDTRSVHEYLAELVSALLSREHQRGLDQVLAGMPEDLTVSGPTGTYAATVSAFLRVVLDNPARWRLILTLPDSAPANTALTCDARVRRSSRRPSCWPRPASRWTRDWPAWIPRFSATPCCRSPRCSADWRSTTPRPFRANASSSSRWRRWV